MMVVVAIFLIIMGVILVNLPNLREQKVLDLVAQEVVTTVRQVQIYGVSSKKFGSSYPSYGIHFDQAKPTQFKTFADLGTSPNKIYDGSGEDLETYNFPSSIIIKSVCVGSVNINTGTCTGVSAGDAVYTSPNIDPDITSNASEIQVTLKSTVTNKEKTIHIAASGMVYAQ